MTRLGLGLLVAVLLGACGSVPTSGPIRQGPVVESGESTQFIRVIAAPPSPGASAEGIVRGFLEASPSFEHDHAIARRYLTLQAAQAWRPAAAVRVYDPDSLRVTSSGSQVRVRLDTVGHLGADGALTAVDPPEPDTVVFGMERVSEDGTEGAQWRIGEPPGRLLISSTDLRRAYRPYQVMFASDRSPALVPDTRLVPVVGASLPTRLAQLVTNGPTDWLRTALHTGLPDGAGLAVDAVPVVDGIARVTLTDQARMVTGDQRRDLAAALTWTLTQLPEVSWVTLELAGGEPYPVPGAPVELARSMWPARAPDVTSLGIDGERRPAGYVLDDSGLVRVGASGRTRIPVEGAPAAELTGLTVQPDEQGAAAIDADGGAVWLLPFAEDAATRVPTGAGVTDLAADADGHVLVVRSGRVERIVADNTLEPVAVGPEDLGAITSLSVARDGARVAVIVQGRAYVGALRESEDGLAIESLHRSDTELAGVTQIAWHDAQTLDVLGVRAGQGRPEVWRLWVGTSRIEPLGAPGQARELASAPGSVSLAATAAGQIMGNVGQQWRVWGEGRSVAYPG